MIRTSETLGGYWISSISRLPMFYKPGTIISGMMCGDTGEEFFPVQYRIWTGRDIQILNGIHKYKLEIGMTGSNQACEIVGIGDVPFTMQNIKSVPGKFYPIYMRYPNGCYLFTTCIDRMFKELNMVITADTMPS